MSERLKVGQQTIRDWESNKRKPQKVILPYIAEAYELPLDLTEKAWTTLSRQEYYRVKGIFDKEAK